MNATTINPRWTACLLLTLAMLAGRPAWAQSAGSSGYRVEGTLTPSGAGVSSGQSRTVFHVIAAPGPLGDSASDALAVTHGWSLPAPALALYRYALAAGWNLKGAPGTSDQSAGAIFTGPSGFPLKVGNLQYPTAAGTVVEADDSEPIVGLQAFWVFSYWGGRGQPFAVLEAHTPGDGTDWQTLLQPGWNLFSPPYVVTVPRHGTVVVVWRWDPAASAYQVVLPGHNLLPLEGYWVYNLEVLP